MVLPLVLSLAALAAPDAGPADPLAPARDGMMQCYGPDAARRTCKSIAGYTFGSDGVMNQAEVLVSPAGPMVMKAATPVVVREGAVCGPVRAEDIDASQVVFAGRPLAGAQAEKVKAQMKSGLGPVLGAEVCTTYVPAPQGYTTQVTVNGTPAPDMSNSQVIWVRSDEGWTVAP